MFEELVSKDQNPTCPICQFHTEKILSVPKGYTGNATAHVHGLLDRVGAGEFKE